MHVIAECVHGGCFHNIHLLCLQIGKAACASFKWDSCRFESTISGFAETLVTDSVKKPDPAIAKRALQEAAERRAEQEKIEKVDRIDSFNDGR